MALILSAITVYGLSGPSFGRSSRRSAVIAPTHSDRLAPEWPYVANAMDELGSGEETNFNAAIYRVRLAAAGANCSPLPEQVVNLDRRERLAIVYERLSCTPLPFRSRHLRWPSAIARVYPPSSILAAPPVQGLVDLAIARGAAVAGVDVAYLRSTAISESALKPDARSSRSSAEGLYQFLEATWLSSVRRYGPALGLERAANVIEPGRGGRLTIRDPDARFAVLALRLDPLVASALAGMLTRENAGRLEASGLPVPDRASLYAAHVLGPKGAARLARLTASQPQLDASLAFPAEARSNPGLFFLGRRARSVAELALVFRDKAAA